MLILSRKAGEAIQIGEHVVVTVVGVNGGQVRLGVEAPKHIAVHREEIFERIMLERGPAPAKPAASVEAEAEPEVASHS